MKLSSKEKNTAFIKQKAKELGFDFCGISEATKLVEEEKHFHQWLSNGRHAEMGYMANHFDKRLDPTKLVPGAKSVISLLYNYYPGNNDPLKGRSFKIAKYAYGKDYHFVIKDKLKTLLTHVIEEIGEVAGRVFVDSAPVMERQWAAKSGLGWLGKNTLLLNKQHGSFFFIAEMILDLPLLYDGPIKDYCGSCTRCIDACPTGAIMDEGVLDAGKCISYFTIELKEEIPQEYHGKWDNWIFGCDICQDVCPWNRFSTPHREKAFEVSEELRDFTEKDWVELTEEVFKNVFKGSALERTKYQGIKRNISFIKKKTR